MTCWWRLVSIERGRCGARVVCGAVQVLAEFSGRAWIGGDWGIDALVGEQTRVCDRHHQRNDGPVFVR
ncbi:nucleotidyltransferase domain-containing protein [Streptomyces sp. NPDC008240]|uniref:nucleotidyltransferase domain-containing protein n=1 Tax=Streptomyces sp. NPDC008240 TaxID=3364822 RepID=UPI0036E59485